ncbi:MAG: hypothetical protein ABWW69_04565 [Pyrodictiaceae archaeon]
MPGPLEAYRWLLSLGVPEELARRAVRLARRASVVRMEEDYAIIIVPSQRRERLRPEHVVSHVDLEALLKGERMRHTVAVVGELPEDQQAYAVKVTREGASCTCPVTRLAHAPLCVHRLAAVVLLYRHDRRSLLAWLPKAVRDYLEWWRRWRQTIVARYKPRRVGGAPLTIYSHS